jgi:hypothetical protein
MMTNSFIARLTLTILAGLTFGLTAHVFGQVDSLAVNPQRLTNGDRRPKTVTLSASLPAGASIHIAVDFRPSLDSSSTQFIQTYEVRDNDDRDSDRRAGSIRTTLTRSFDNIGIYHIRLAESRSVLTVVHEPGRTWWSWVDDLFGAAGGGERAGDAPIDDSVTVRLNDRPVLSSIWVARVPAPRRDIKSADLSLKVRAAVTPSWSHDATLLACGAWRQNRWKIAAYRFGGAGEMTEKWQWTSPSATADFADFSPVWAPNGRNVAFIRRTGDNETDIWLLYLDVQGMPTREARLTNLSGVRQLIAWDDALGLLFELEREAAGTTRVREIWSMIVRPDQQQVAGVASPRPARYSYLRGNVAGRNSVIFDEQATSPPLTAITEKRTGNSETILLTGGECRYWWPAVSRNGQWLALESDCPAPGR